jgi:hypothetical protein
VLTTDARLFCSRYGVYCQFERIDLPPQKHITFNLTNNQYTYVRFKTRHWTPGDSDNPYQLQLNIRPALGTTRSLSVKIHVHSAVYCGYAPSECRGLNSTNPWSSTEHHDHLIDAGVRAAAISSRTGLTSV